MESRAENKAALNTDLFAVAFLALLIGGALFYSLRFLAALLPFGGAWIVVIPLIFLPVLLAHYTLGYLGYSISRTDLLIQVAFAGALCFLVALPVALGMGLLGAEISVSRELAEVLFLVFFLPLAALLLSGQLEFSDEPEE